MMKAYKHIFPENSLISKQLPAFFADSYAVDVSNAETLSTDAIQIQFWTQRPFENTLGRIYFTIIRPFHGILVKSSLKQAITNSMAYAANH